MRQLDFSPFRNIYPFPSPLSSKGILRVTHIRAGQAIHQLKEQIEIEYPELSKPGLAIPSDAAVDSQTRVCYLFDKI